jgi:uncharacterized membrane protein
MPPFDGAARLRGSRVDRRQFLDSQWFEVHNGGESGREPSHAIGRLGRRARAIAMSKWFSNPFVEAMVWCAALALLIALAVYAVGRFRGGAEEERLGASELLSNFREVHSEGGLSDEEFRTIKTLLSEKLQRELRNSGEKG